MSSNLALELPARSPRRDEPERRIEIVSTRSQRRARPRPLYAVIVVAGLFAVFLAQLLLSIVVSDGAYQISSLQSQQADLARTAQSLSEQVDTLSSTQNLATKAEGLGMVLGSSTPAFLNIADGKVVGKSHSAKGSAKGVIGTTGNLVPNSLLAPDDASAESGTTAKTTTADPQNELTTSGAPDATADGGSVTSKTGLPSPETR